MFLRSLLAAWTAALLLSPLGAAAQSPAPASAISGTYVLIPYQEPDATDPHAADVTTDLSSDLSAAGVNVTVADPVAHLDAVAGASAICTKYHAAALLVPEGRAEQTTKRFQVSFVLVVSYPTHAELRLDEVGCDGSVRWSNVATGDKTRTGAYSVGNVGADVDDTFRMAAQKVTAAFVAASAQTAASIAADPAATAQPGPAAAAPYLLVNAGQPGIADPRSNDITHSLLVQMQQRKLGVKQGPALDDLTIVADAPKLCASNGAGGIVVPTVRVEQSGFTLRTHAVVRLTLVNCSGAVNGYAMGSSDISGGFSANYGAQIVGASERAMIPALDQLFPATKAAT